MWIIIFLNKLLEWLSWSLKPIWKKIEQKTIESYYQDFLRAYKHEMFNLKKELHDLNDSLVNQKYILKRECEIVEQMRQDMFRKFEFNKAAQINSKLAAYRCERNFNRTLASNELYELFDINKSRIEFYNDTIVCEIWFKDFEHMFKACSSQKEYQNLLENFVDTLKSKLFDLEQTGDFDAYFERVKNLIGLNVLIGELYEHFYFNELEKNHNLEEEIRHLKQSQSDRLDDEIQNSKEKLIRLREEVNYFTNENSQNVEEIRLLRTIIDDKDKKIAEFIKISDKSELIDDYLNEIKNLKQEVKLKDRELSSNKNEKKFNDQINQQQLENKLKKLKSIINEKDNEINYLKLDVRNLRSNIEYLLARNQESPRRTNIFESPLMSPTSPHHHSPDKLINYVYASRGSCNNKPIYQGPAGRFYYKNSSNHKQYVKEDQIRLKD
jgi:hypothetical protein